VTGRRPAELLGQDVVIGKPFRKDRPAHALALEIGLRHEIDGALLVHAKTGGLPGELDLAGTQYDLGGGSEEDRVNHLGIQISDRAIDRDIVDCRSAIDEEI
jgi:hypothetical protein